MKTQEIRKSIPLLIPVLVLAVVLSVFAMRIAVPVTSGEEVCPLLVDDGTGSDPDFG